jgi:hypothetical protein
MPTCHCGRYYHLQNSLVRHQRTSGCSKNFFPQTTRPSSSLKRKIYDDTPYLSSSSSVSSDTRVHKKSRNSCSKCPSKDMTIASLQSHVESLKSEILFLRSLFNNNSSYSQNSSVSFPEVLEESFSSEIDTSFDFASLNTDVDALI